MRVSSLMTKQHNLKLLENFADDGFANYVTYEELEKCEMESD